MPANKIARIEERLLKGYSENYNITRYHGAGGIVAEAEYHVSESGYVFFRKAQTWTADSDEYVFFVEEQRLTADIAEEYVRHAYDEGIRRIDIENRKHHMCTRVVVVFLCNDIDEKAGGYIRKCRLRRDFCFALKGWMEVHVAAAVLGEKGDMVICNRAAKETGKFIESVLEQHSLASV